MKWILWMATFAMDVLGAIAVLFLTAIGGNQLWWDEGLWGRFKEDRWGYRAVCWLFKKVSGKDRLGGVTLGHHVMLSETAGPRVIAHEKKHKIQFEAIALGVFILACICAGWNWVFALVFWAVGPTFFYCCAMLAAWLNGEKAYRDCYLEKSARALTKLEEV